MRCLHLNWTLNETNYSINYKDMPSIHFLPDDKVIEIETGESILRASLRAGIPHTYVCGGNAPSVHGAPRVAFC